jgi:biopolymer transport protein ExbD
MYNKLMEQPRLIVSLRVDEESEMGVVQDVQMELRQANTLRVNYSTKRQTVTAPVIFVIIGAFLHWTAP